MKNRICAALLTLVLCLPLAGCAGGASSGISVSYPAEPSSGAGSGMQAGKAYTVGILQQMEHTSLDEIREAFADDSSVEIVNIGDSVRARRIIEGTDEGRNILNTLEKRSFL